MTETATTPRRLALAYGRDKLNRDPFDLLEEILA